MSRQEDIQQKLSNTILSTFSKQDEVEDMIEAIEDVNDDWTNVQVDINRKLSKKAIENQIVFEERKFDEFDIVDMRVNKKTCRLCLKNMHCPIHTFGRAKHISLKNNERHEALEKVKKE